MSFSKLRVMRLFLLLLVGLLLAAATGVLHVFLPNGVLSGDGLNFLGRYPQIHMLESGRTASTLWEFLRDFYEGQNGRLSIALSVGAFWSLAHTMGFNLQNFLVNFLPQRTQETLGWIDQQDRLRRVLFEKLAARYRPDVLNCFRMEGFPRNPYGWSLEPPWGFSAYIRWLFGREQKIHAFMQEDLPSEEALATCSQWEVIRHLDPGDIGVGKP